MNQYQCTTDSAKIQQGNPTPAIRITAQPVPLTEDIYTRLARIYDLAIRRYHLTYNVPAPATERQDGDDDR